MRNWRHLVGGMALLSMQLGGVPISARADQSGDYIYETDGTNAAITQYTGTARNVTIPDTLDGYPVTVIGDSAFYSCTSATNVVVPAGVTNIGNSAFSYSFVVSVILPDSVRTIGDAAFSDTELRSITLPANLNRIGDSTFFGCGKLTRITIPESVSSIGSNAFYYCGMPSVTVPAGVTNIGSGAFACSSLSTLYFEGNAPAQFGADLFTSSPNLKTVYYNAGITGWPATLSGLPTTPTDPAIAQFGWITNGSTVTITQYHGGESAACIPGEISGMPVTGIAMNAFLGEFRLTSIGIPSSVVSIGDSAFYSATNLTRINVDRANANYCDVDGVLFDKPGATLLQYPPGRSGSYEMPNGVTTIKGMVYTNCLGGGAFTGCTSLTGIAMPDTVADIQMWAFTGCSRLSNVVMSANLTNIGDWAFTYCSALTNIVVPKGVTNIGQRVFCYCSQLKNVVLSDGLTMIGDSAFGGCTNLASIVIPESVTSILQSAFGGCSSLRKVEIPNRVTYIGRGAFGACASLTGVFFDGSAPTAENGVFDRSGVTNVYYMTGTTGWTNTFSWLPALPSPDPAVLDFAWNTIGATVTVTLYRGGDSAVTIPDKIVGLPVVGIGDCVFQNSKVTRITLPNSVTSIGNGAFYYCRSLAGIALPKGLTSIGDLAFDGCSGLTNVALSDGITNLGYSVFSGCSGLASVTVPAGVGNIQQGAFANCSRLRSLTIPASVTNVGDSAFYGCNHLTNIAIANGVSVIGNYAFSGCSLLNSVALPSSVTNLGEAVFSGCNWLKAITVDPSNPAYCDVDGVVLSKDGTTLVQYPTGRTGGFRIPGTVTNICDGAFAYCNNLTGVFFDANPPAQPAAPLFSGTQVKTVYYGNGAAGWPATFGGLPTALADPAVLTFKWKTNGSTISITGFLGGNPNVTIPETISGMDVTSIEDSAFNTYNNLYSVSIPRGVTNIGNYAFYSCGLLTNVTINGSLSTIGDFAFSGCSRLTSIRFIGDAPTIGLDPFSPDLNLVIYYAAGTSGWMSVFGGYPTAVWGESGPNLSIQLNGTQVVLRWSQGSLLESTNLATGVWTTNSTVQSPYLITPESPQKFYRVQ